MSARRHFPARDKCLTTIKSRVAYPLRFLQRVGPLFFCDLCSSIWRGRVEVESTIRPAKGRIAGFEGREGHRTPFAPAVRISLPPKTHRTMRISTAETVPATPC